MLRLGTDFQIRTAATAKTNERAKHSPNIITADLGRGKPARGRSYAVGSFLPQKKATEMLVLKAALPQCL